MTALAEARRPRTGSMIEIERATRVYPDGTAALDAISLHIPPGQFVALVGPSGCGKSTLLSLIAGFDTPSQGTVRLAGRAAMVFQEAALFPWRTVRDNVSFGLQMHGLSRAERTAKADAALKLVHLSRFADAYPHQLSGGMRQRAAIARALVLEPDALLMDEPFGSLDAQTRALLQDELLSIWERTRPAVVFVTHGMDEALRLADRILLLSARPGRVLADLPVDAPRPRDPQADLSLAALRTHLSDLLTAEVAAVARAEHDEDWQSVRPAVPPEDDPGAEI